MLLCCATALGDVEIEYEATAAPSAIRQYTAQVVKMEKLSYDVMRVMLELPEGQQIPFKAGQYINIILDDGQRRAFSFANPPHQPGLIELQIRLMPGGRYTTHVFEQMKQGDTVNFEGPLGDFSLRESERPIVFVAGATGFAPVKSMVEDAFHRGLKRPIYLYWGVRKLADLYLPDLPQQWDRDHENFHFIPVLSDAAPEDNWTGRTGLVHEAILADFPDLARQGDLRLRLGENGRSHLPRAEEPGCGGRHVLLRCVHHLGTFDGLPAEAVTREIHLLTRPPGKRRPGA